MLEFLEPSLVLHAIVAGRGFVPASGHMLLHRQFVPNTIHTWHIVGQQSIVWLTCGLRHQLIETEDLGTHTWQWSMKKKLASFVGPTMCCMTSASPCCFPPFPPGLSWAATTQGGSHHTIDHIVDVLRFNPADPLVNTSGRPRSGSPRLWQQQ